MARIGILTEGMAQWQGGVDFLSFLCDCLQISFADRSVALLPLFPRTPVREAVHKATSPWRQWLAESVQHGRLLPWREILREQMDRSSLRQLARIRDVMGSAQPVLRFCGDEELATLARAEKLDCLLPAFRPLAGCVATPWLGYLYDFQHRHLPHLFRAEERAGRDAHFAAMARQARYVLVNSRAVADDCRRFLGPGGATFVPLPFGAAPKPDWFADEPGRLAKYGLPERYFLVSNQFWTHKNHRVVFEALRLLGPTAGVAVVCTGSTLDARDRGYFPSLRRFLDESGISSRVRILDCIPKRDQIEIMKRAIAVVQPTLSEGGPGGGAVYDAVSLGVPALVSDIPVNRELEGQGLEIQFFEPSRADALAALMLDHARNPRRQRKDAATLLAEGRQRRRAVGAVLLETMRAAGAALP
ncbi:MAG: glycosyltransferase [Deltaproteobacteria bacterium]|nr:glycosyltransferase [Deltaproteobacteria bacterium]